MHTAVGGAACSVSETESQRVSASTALIYFYELSNLWKCNWVEWLFRLSIVKYNSNSGFAVIVK